MSRGLIDDLVYAFIASYGGLRPKEIYNMLYEDMSQADFRRSIEWLLELRIIRINSKGGLTAL